MDTTPAPAASASIIHRDREVSCGTWEEMCLQASRLVARLRRTGRYDANVYITSGGKVYEHRGSFIREVR